MFPKLKTVATFFSKIFTDVFNSITTNKLIQKCRNVIAGFFIVETTTAIVFGVNTVKTMIFKETAETKKPDLKAKKGKKLDVKIQKN